MTSPYQMVGSSEESRGERLLVTDLAGKKEACASLQGMGILKLMMLAALAVESNTIPTDFPPAIALAFQRDLDMEVMGHLQILGGTPQMIYLHERFR